jgi:hypothetical protein
MRSADSDHELPETGKAQCPFCQGLGIRPTTRLRVSGDSIKIGHQCASCWTKFWIVMTLPAPAGGGLVPPPPPIGRALRPDP